MNQLSAGDFFYIFEILYTNLILTFIHFADRAFVKEWAKFRYGVFEELGFPNDPIYPTYYKQGGERKPTSCTNLPLRGNW